MADTFAPIGAIFAYAGSLEKLPENWIVCDGSEVDKGDMPDLFAVIGTAWGGTDPKFHLPDLRGMFLRGVDRDQTGTPSAPPRDPERDARTAIGVGGASGNNAGSKQTGSTAFPKSGFVVSTVGDHTHLDPTWNGGAGPFELAVGPARGPGGSDFIPANNTSAAGAHAHTIAGGDVETRPVNAYVYWIIRFR